MSFCNYLCYSNAGPHALPPLRAVLFSCILRKAMHCGKFSYMKILSFLMNACDLSDLLLFVHTMIELYTHIVFEGFSQSACWHEKPPTPPAVDLCEWHVDDLSHTFTAMFRMDCYASNIIWHLKYVENELCNTHYCRHTVNSNTLVTLLKISEWTWVKLTELDFY